MVNKLKEVAKNDTDEGNASEEWQDNATGFERQFEVCNIQNKQASKQVAYVEIYLRYNLFLTQLQDSGAVLPA